MGLNGSVPVNDGDDSEEPGSSDQSQSQSRLTPDEESELSNAFEALSIQDLSNEGGPVTQDENPPSLPEQQELDQGPSDLDNWDEQNDADSERREQEIFNNSRRLYLLRLQMYHSLGALDDKCGEILDCYLEMIKWHVKVGSFIGQLGIHWDSECSAPICEGVNFRCCEKIWEVTEYSAARIKDSWTLAIGLRDEWPNEEDKFLYKFKDIFDDEDLPGPSYVETRISELHSNWCSRVRRLSDFKRVWRNLVDCIRMQLNIMKERMNGRDDMERGTLCQTRENFEIIFEMPDFA